jgi:hypothetical protein
LSCVVPVVTSTAGEEAGGSPVTLVVGAVSSVDLLGPAAAGLGASAVGLRPVFLLLALPMLLVAVAGYALRLDRASPSGTP